MSLFKEERGRVGTIIKVAEGRLGGKYAMVAKEYKEGVGVVTAQEDWPVDVPSEYNGYYVGNDNIVEIPLEEQALVKVKFPNPDQFE